MLFPATYLSSVQLPLKALYTWLSQGNGMPVQGQAFISALYYNISSAQSRAHPAKLLQFGNVW